MNKECLKNDIIELIKKHGNISIKEITRIYNECLNIPKRDTRKIINELINDKILVRIDDVDCFGNKIDEVTMN